MAKAGRPEKAEGEKRSRRFLIRFSPATFSELERLAAERGLTKAGFIDWLIRRASSEGKEGVG